MPQLINVNFSDDPNYRYKMEVPIITHEGQGKHDKKTVLVNAQEIAAALRRTTDEFAKHIELYLSTIQIKDKSLKVKFGGYYDNKDMTGAIRDFINKYVMCKKCQYPETDHTYKQDRIISKCRTCGNVFEITTKQNKLVNYLIRRNFATEQIKRRHTPVERITTKVQRLSQAENAEELITSYLKEIVESGELYEEEKLPLLIAAYFKASQANDVEQWKKLIKLLSNPDVTPKDLQIYYLYGLELLVKQQEELFDTNKDLLAAILQMSSFLDEAVVKLYQSDQAEPFVPEDYHQKCLTMGEPYFAWIADQGLEEEEEEERE